MNLDNFYHASLALTLIFMLVFVLCLFLFYYLELGRVSVGKDTFLFFDFMLFRTSWLANFSAISVAGVIISGNLFDYVRSHNASALHLNTIGFIATLLFFVHCRIYSDIIYSGLSIKCAKELFFNLKLHTKYSLLWLSRVGYVTFIIFSLAC